MRETDTCRSHNICQGQRVPHPGTWLPTCPEVPPDGDLNSVGIAPVTALVLPEFHRGRKGAPTSGAHGRPFRVVKQPGRHRPRQMSPFPSATWAGSCESCLKSR